MRSLLGGKGANVAEMLRIGVPVPDGFTVTTEACVATMRDGAWPDGLEDEIEDAADGARGAHRPRARRRRAAAARLRALRRGPLDAGDDGHDPQPRHVATATAEALAAESGNERFAWDSYRRFVQMYGEVVEGVPGDVYEHALTPQEVGARRARRHRPRRRRPARPRRRVPPAHDRARRRRCPTTRASSCAAPSTPSSAPGRTRAPPSTAGRTASPDDLGTAVNVMQMVFGNLGDDSGTGVCFTRNPSTGEREVLRRVPRQRPGRGRRRRHPHAAAAARARAGAARPRTRELIATMARLEAPLPRHAGHRVHDRARHALPAADAHRQAHRAGGACAIARDLVAEGVIEREEAVGAHRPARPRPAAAPDDRPASAAASRSRAG